MGYVERCIIKQCNSMVFKEGFYRFHRLRFKGMRKGYKIDYNSGNLISPEEFFKKEKEAKKWEERIFKREKPSIKEIEKKEVEKTDKIMEFLEDKEICDKKVNGLLADKIRFEEEIMPSIEYSENFKTKKEKNPNWNGGNSQYPNHHVFKIHGKIILEKHPFCEI